MQLTSPTFTPNTTFENLYYNKYAAGSSLTFILRKFDDFFYTQADLQSAQGHSWQAKALRITRFVLSIFVYPIFGLLALVGVGINALHLHYHNETMKAWAKETPASPNGLSATHKQAYLYPQNETPLYNKIFRTHKYSNNFVNLETAEENQLDYIGERPYIAEPLATTQAQKPSNEQTRAFHEICQGAIANHIDAATSKALFISQISIFPNRAAMIESSSASSVFTTYQWEASFAIAAEGPVPRRSVRQEVPLSTVNNEKSSTPSTPDEIRL